MRERCDICQGRGFIRLPIYREVSSHAGPDGGDIQESARQYPCPECSPSAPIERVALVEHHREFFIPDGYPPELKARECETAARALGDDLLRRGFIRLAEYPSKPEMFGRRYEIVATVAVASKADLGRIEDRIAADREVFGKAVVESAVAQVANWGSAYGHQSIAKRDAYNLIRSALDHAKLAFTKLEIKT